MPTLKSTQAIEQEITPDGNITGKQTAAPVKTKEALEHEQQLQQQIQTTPKEEIVEEVIEPVKEVVEEPEVKFDQFLDAKESQEIVEQRKVEEQQKKIEEQKKEEKVVEQQKQSTVPPKPAARDYSDIPEEDQPLFKSMANESFAKLKPVYLEHKKLKQDLQAKEVEITETKKQLDDAKKGIVQIPDSYHSHQEAYILTPEFAQTASAVNDAQIIYNHWVNQLKAVREGAKEFDFIDRDPRNGQLVISRKVPADIDSETALMTYINYGQNILMQTQAKLQAVKESYGTKYNEAIKTLQQQEQQYFGQLTANDENKKIYTPLIDQQLQTLPPAFRNNPLANLYAKSLAQNMIFARMLQQIVTQQQQQQQVKPKPGRPAKQPVVVNRGNPTAEEAAGDGGESGNNGDNVTTDDFERAKQGL